LSTPTSKAGYNPHMTQHIYLSPHPDDAVFSCGGLIAHQTAAGESVTVLTICAGDPPPGELTPFAQELHDRWETEVASNAARRAEDVAACEHLSAIAVHLDVPDAVYRKAHHGKALYPNEAAIFGELHECETDMVNHLVQELAFHIPAQAVLYCPLGYGGHVDHRLTRRAAEGLDRLLRYYAELPYAMRGELIPEEMGLPQGEKRLVELDSREMEAWVAASALYRSQLSTFWMDENAQSVELRGFHRREKGLPIIVEDI